MKKIIFMFLFCFIFIDVNASSIVMDMDTKRVLYDDNMNEERLIASTTKIMTAMVVINNVDISKTLKINEEVLKSYGSGIYIEVGERIRVIDLLYGLMLRSGNDAAIALANYVGGSMEGFVLMMNDLAQSLDMKNTRFINASGLEDEKGNGNTSTAYDMALLMSYAMQNEIFATITHTKNYKVKTNYKVYDWYNKNKLLGMYKYTTGGKTGYTKLAKRTLVTSASKDNKNLCVVTLNESDDFNLHKNLYDEYFKKYKLVNIIDATTFLRNDGLYVKENFDMLLKDNEIDNVDVEVVHTNDAVNREGYVSVKLNGVEYYKEDIYVIENKKNSILGFIQRFFYKFFS